MKRKDVKVVDKVRTFEGYFQVDRYTISHRKFEGGWTPPFMREVFERGHAVVVLLYDPVLDVLVFVEQFRIGAYAAQKSTKWWPRDASPWLIECVAGIIDDGETPEEVAQREAFEESGCTVQELIPIHQIYATPGASTETNFIFCGRIDASQAGGIHGIEDENEDIRVIKAPAAETFQWLNEGRIVHATTIVALQWFRENHRHLRAKWRGPAR